MHSACVAGQFAAVFSLLCGRMPDVHVPAQDKYHLYLLFDLMSGGDLMDVLVAEARVIRRRIAQGAWRRACLAPKARSCAAWAWVRTVRFGLGSRALASPPGPDASSLV